jgi:hypothetical protein
MNSPKPRLFLNRHYRLGYTTNNGASECNAFHTFTNTTERIEYCLRNLASHRQNYPNFTFWLEEGHEDGSWHKLPETNMYELFSTDPEKPKRPRQLKLKSKDADIPF